MGQERINGAVEHQVGKEMGMADKAVTFILLVVVLIMERMAV